MAYETGSVSSLQPREVSRPAPLRGPEPLGGTRDFDRRQLDDARGGVWGWFMQRVTAVILIVGLGTHLVATHIQSAGELSYGNIAARLAAVLFVVIDASLLAAAIFHGLNGLRMVVLDYFWKARRQRLVLTWLLWVFGVAFFLYGLWALWPWIS
jgi:succinate dehydrogenase / fumarate reductase membrane anchor subunit